MGRPPKSATLTYPDVVVSEKGKNGEIVEIRVEDITEDMYRQHIKDFKTSLIRKYPECFVFVRMEQVERQSSNECLSKLVNCWYLEVFNVGFLDEDWIRSAWNRILTLGLDREYLQAETQVEGVRSFWKTIEYLSKCEKEGKKCIVWNKDRMREHLTRYLDWR